MGKGSTQLIVLKTTKLSGKVQRHHMGDDQKTFAKAERWTRYPSSVSQQCPQRNYPLTTKK
jgi:hypothetical protein